MDNYETADGSAGGAVFDPCEALTVKAVAKLLNMSEPTVRKHIRGGLLPSVIIGGCRRIRRIDLEDFLQRRTLYGWRAVRGPQADDRPNDMYSEAPAWSSEGEGNIPF